MYEMFLFNSVNSKITQNVNEEFILKYSDYSCEQLNSLWKEVGLGSYYNGLFKVIEPNDLKDIINQCYIMDDDESLLPFMCTAFGDVFRADQSDGPDPLSQRTLPGNVSDRNER